MKYRIVQDGFGKYQIEHERTGNKHVEKSLFFITYLEKVEYTYWDSFNLKQYDTIEEAESSLKSLLEWRKKLHTPKVVIKEIE